MARHARRWSKRSRRALVNQHSRLHGDLVEILDETLQRSPLDFILHDGGRFPKKQARMIATGASQTMDSRHIIDRFGIHYAVDFVPWLPDPSHPKGGVISWSPIHYLPIVRTLFVVAAAHGVPTDWGGWWEGTRFGKDYAHIALEREFYPPNGQTPLRAHSNRRLRVDPQTGLIEGSHRTGRSHGIVV